MKKNYGYNKGLIHIPINGLHHRIWQSRAEGKFHIPNKFYPIYDESRRCKKHNNKMSEEITLKRATCVIFTQGAELRKAHGGCWRPIYPTFAQHFQYFILSFEFNMFNFFSSNSSQLKKSFVAI